MLKIISTIKRNMAGQNWEILGILNKSPFILPVGCDSKILGRVFEILMHPILYKCSLILGCKLEASKSQTVYPDFWFQFMSGKKIAIDIKSTYRKMDKNGQLYPFNFTLGSYSSYIRNETKNIEGNLKDYIGHIVVGFLYDRNKELPRIDPMPLCEITKCIPPYMNVEYFVQEKYKIAGQTKGSGNTNNISTIRSRDIKDFQNGLSYFSDFGEEIFYDYWQHYPLYTEDKKLYTDLNGYFQWLRIIEKHELADELERKYAIWIKKFGTTIK